MAFDTNSFMMLRFVVSGWIAAGVAVAQASLPVKWEEITSGDFVAAIQKAQSTCVLPFGILEKHGPHLPLGTDLINVRYAALKGAEQEYAVRPMRIEPSDGVEPPSCCNPCC